MRNSLILGFFDGVHIAHQTVIKSALSAHSILITFTKSPVEYFQGHAEYILSRECSLKKIYAMGVKEVLELDFAKIANISAEVYLKKIAEQYAPISISTGFNYTFGVNKLGNSDFLALNQNTYGYKYFCIPPQKDGDDIISSTLIRRLLSEGNIERANKLLGSNFILEGCVVHGMKLARKIGFPTANMFYPKNIVKIPFGVYIAKVFGKNAVVNWGKKPTFNNDVQPILEVHIPNFYGELYGQNLCVEIIKKIRDEKKFSSVEELQMQINEDVKKCLEL